MSDNPTIGIGMGTLISAIKGLSNDRAALVEAMMCVLEDTHQFEEQFTRLLLTLLRRKFPDEKEARIFLLSLVAMLIKNVNGRHIGPAIREAVDCLTRQCASTDGSVE